MKPNDGSEGGKPHGPVEIIPFSEDLREPIKTLNYDWLETYFRVEEGDVIQLNDPQKEIIDKGGMIFYARQGNHVVGTATLMKIDDDVYELGKMAVSRHARGRGIGTLLLEHCLSVAREGSVRKIILYSNTRLAPAIHLYRKYGFTEVTLENGHYRRANIKMEKLL